MNDDLFKAIEKLRSTSKHRSKPIEVIQDMAQAMFNLMTTPAHVADVAPISGFYYRPEFRTHVRDIQRRPEDAQALHEAVAIWIRSIHESAPFTDVMTNLLAPHCGDKLAQFLTPPDLAAGLLPFLTGALKGQMVPDHEEIHIADPAGCGAGSLILGQLKYIHEIQGHEAVSRVHVIGVDLDPTMAMLTAVQIGMNVLVHRLQPASIHIHCGNGITDYDDERKGYGLKTLIYLWERVPKHTQSLCPEFRAFTEVMKKLKNSQEKASR